MPDQASISRIGGLHHTLKLALETLATEWGAEAPAKLVALRDEAVLRFKISGIPADRELEHAAVVGPAIEAIEETFATVLSDLSMRR